MRLAITEFGGIAPRFPDIQLKVPFAIDAANCTMERGQLRAFNAPSASFTAVPPSTIATNAFTMFRYKPANFEYLLTFPERTYCIQNPLPSDAYKRVYWLGSSGVIRYGSMANVLAGSGPYPATNSGFILGVPAPVARPTLVRVPYNAEVVDPETTDGKIPSYRVVTYSWVSQFNEFSGMYAPSDGSALESVKLYEGDRITVSGLGTAPSGNYAMGSGARKALFCSDSNGNWRLVAYLPLGTTTYTFDPFSMDTAPVASNALYETPPAGLDGIALSPFGFMYGWKDNTLCVSDILMFHTWNSDYQKTLPFKILGIVPTTQGGIVMTEGGCYALLGTDPATLDAPPITGTPACVSVDSIVDMGGYAMYAADDGIVVCNTSGGQVVTEDVILRSQFPDYNPAAFRCFRHRSCYVITSPTLTAVLNPDAVNSKLMPLVLPRPITAGFTNSIDGCLYYKDGSSKTVYRFDAEDDAMMTAFWKSPTLRAGHRLQCRWLGIDGETLQGCRIVVRANGVDVSNGGIVPNKATRFVVAFPPFCPTTDYQIEIYITSAAINSVKLATSMRELSDD